MTTFSTRLPSVNTAGISDRGLIRKRNEDSFYYTDQVSPVAGTFGSFGIYVVADGIGGNAGGEAASRCAVDEVSAFLLEELKNGSITSPSQSLRLAATAAHEAILNLTKGQSNGPMGTTLVAALRLDYDLYVAHLGDSRGYLIRNGKVRQLTEDHSVLANLIRRGVVAPEAANSHPDKGKIFRCLGISATAEPDTVIRGSTRQTVRLRDGDRLLFCTDGLTDVASEAAIMRAFRNRDNPECSAKWLIEFANARGGFDNVTAVVVHLKERWATRRDGTGQVHPHPSITETAEANSKEIGSFATCAPED